MSTQGCKDFISSISHIINSSGTWKRVNKYKKNQYILRDFIHESGSTLTVAQLNDQFFLTKLNIILEPSELTEEMIPGTKFIGQPATEEDLFQFMAQCVYDDHSIVDLDVVEDAINPKSWTIWEEITGKNLKDLIKESNGDQLYLFYKNSKGYPMQMIPKEINKIFWVGLKDYDTAYRIYVFESKNYELMLGCNDPD